MSALTLMYTFMRKMAQGLRSFVRIHRVWSGLLLIALVWGGYRAYAVLTTPATVARYVLAAPEQGTLVVSVSGSGQVSALDQVQIKPKVSGDVVSVAVESGQSVKAGQLLFRIDSSSAQKTVRDAQANLENAKISFQKLTQPADALSILQAGHALTASLESVRNASDTITRSYTDGYNAVANAFLDFPDAMTTLNEVLYSNTLSGGSIWNIDYYANSVRADDDTIGAQYRTATDAAYQAARKTFDALSVIYKATPRTADRAAVDALLGQAYTTALSVSDGVKSATDLVQRYNDSVTRQNFKVNPLTTTHLASLTATLGKVNGNLTSLLASQNSIKSALVSFASAERSVSEKEGSLAKLKEGADPLDIASQRLSVEQREQALRDAQDALADYTIRAPFDGVLAGLSIRRGDSVSPNTVAGTILSPKRIAEISLNEVDIAKVKQGQRATLTFDAAPDFKAAGIVTEVDALGAVTQGVVSYIVTIAFDAPVEIVRPGMSVSAAVVTETHNDVLFVPSSAVQTQGNTRYVEVASVSGSVAQLDPTGQGIELAVAPRRQAVEVGASNDTSTEIISGLKESDVIVVRTIASGAAPTAATRTTTSGGLGNVRIPGVGGGFR